MCHSQKRCKTKTSEGDQQYMSNASVHKATVVEVVHQFYEKHLQKKCNLGELVVMHQLICWRLDWASVKFVRAQTI